MTNHFLRSSRQPVARNPNGRRPASTACHSSVKAGSVNDFREKAAPSVGRVDKPCGDWLVWQLMDSAFPTGGFVHSSGLEAAFQYGEVRSRDELAFFLKAGLNQAGHAAFPFVMAAFDAPQRLKEFDLLFDAFTSNHVANRASRAQGRAFQSAVDRIFKSEIHNPKSDDQPFHFAPIFGSCLRQLNVPRATAARMFFFNHLRAALTASVRLNIVGPMEAQRLQRQLAPGVEKLLGQCLSLSIDDITQTSPLLDLWQSAQDRLYSRLFQS